MIKTVIKCIGNYLSDKRRRFRWWRERRHITWRDIRQGTKNLIYWFPAVWKDRWWDHSFLYSILRWKLIQMEKGFRLYGISTRAQDDAKNIKKCILLLDRLINDDYSKHRRGENIRESLEKEEMLINQDLDLLFKTIRKQIRAWWD
jgi:hypothetical protein